MNNQRQNQMEYAEGVMVDKTGLVVERHRIHIKTGVQEITYQHPKIKKWREDIKRDKHAKIDEAILDKSNI